MHLKRFRALAAALLVLAILSASAGALSEKTIVLTFTGDVTLGGKDDERMKADCFDNVAAEKGYDYFFANFSEMFAGDDLTIANLEGPLTDNKADKSSKTHAFRGKTEFVTILTKGGIDAVTLSNNHVGDYGQQGEKSTRQALEDNGIHWFQDFQYYLYEKDGVKIAFFALQNAVLYKQRAKFLNRINKAREEDGADAVIVCWHTGTEYKRFHEPDTEKKVKGLIEDGGVDLVIINHPHTAQGMGIINNRSVFYSLGNFVFGGNRNIRTGKDLRDPLTISLYGMVVRATLTFSDEGKYLGQQMTVYPVFSSSAQPDYQPEGALKQKLLFSNDYQPMRLTIEQAAAVYQCIREDTAFEIPEMTEKDGLAEIVFPYLPGFNSVMIPENETSDGPSGIPEAANPKPTRDDKADSGN